MQVKFQKFTSTTLPRRSAATSGAEFNHATAPSKGGSLPSIGSGATSALTGQTRLKPVSAKTVNGGIEATLGALAPGGADLQTVNGAVTVQLPEHVNATLDAESVVGRVQADLPVQLTGAVDPKHIRGTLGRGGPTLHVSTVNGEVRLVPTGRSWGPAVPAKAKHPLRARSAVPVPPPAQPPR